MIKTKIARSDKRQKGFTLLEVIVAGGIISAVMLAIVPLLVQSYKIDKATAYRVKAQALTAQKMDDIISLSGSNADQYGNLICQGNSDNGTLYNGPYGDVTDLETGLQTNVVTALTRTWQIVHLTPTAGATDLCQITVSTSFTYQGQTMSFQLVSERGR